VLDLGLPGIDGLTLLRRWREVGLRVPVLVLTARSSWHEKVQGIDSGADDFVGKPRGYRGQWRDRLDARAFRPYFPFALS
jgi:DNA-binding response OmpR family regulator